MSVTPKIEFDNDGLPIPPKRKIEFDDEGLPIPAKVKVPKVAGEDFISKVKRIATQLVTNIKGPGGEIKTPEYPRTAGPVEEKIQVTEEEQLDPNDLIGSLQKTMAPLFKQSAPVADATYVRPSAANIFNEQERQRPEVVKNLEKEKQLKDLKNAFTSDVNLSTTQLMRATGKSANEIQGATREELAQMVRQGNQSDNLAAQTIADARDIRQVFSESDNLEQAAIQLAAIKDPQVARQIEITASKLPARNLGEVVSGTRNVMADPRTLFGEATLGRMIYQLASNPVAVQEIEKNPELKKQFREAVPLLINKYPSFGKSYLGNVISQKMEDMGMNNALLNIVTKEETDNVVDQLAKEGKMSPTEVQFYKDNMREGGIRNFAKTIIGEQLYKTPGLLERTAESAVSAIKATGAGAAEVTGLRPLLVGERAMTARDIAVRDEAVNVRPRNTLNEITAVGGDFLGQVFSTGLLGKGFTSAKLFQNPDNAIKALFGLQAFGNYMPQARAMFPGEGLKQRAYSGILAGLEIATENIFRDKKVVDGLLGKVKPEIASVINKFTAKEISAAAARETVEGAIKSAIKSIPQYTKYFAKGVGENTFEETIVKLGEQLTDGVFTGKKFNDWVNGEELLETARTSALGSTFIAGLSARADMLASKGMTAKMVYDMSEKPEYWIEKIRENAETDPDLQADAEDKIANLEYATKVRQDLEKTNLTEKQKIKFLINALDAHVKGKTSQSITDPVLKKRAEQEAKVVEQQQNDILDGVDQGEIEGDRSDEVVEPGEVAPEVPELTLTEQLSKRMAEIENEEKGAAGKVAPEVPQTVEQLRAAEQAEYAAMPDPNDEVKRKEIYDKYDKLITPLLEKEKEVAAAAPVPSIIEVKSPKEVKQGDTVVWRGEDFTVEEVNAKGGFNLQNNKDRTWTVKDARITDEEFQGKRGEVAAAPAVQKFGVGFAPFREKNVFTEEEDVDIRTSPDYQLHQENVQKVAEGLGIKINNKLDTWGGYVDSETGNPVQEVSNIMEIEATPEQARVMAAILGKAAPEMQDSVLLGNYNEQGAGFEHIVKTGSFANAQEAINLLKDNGLQYFSVDKNSGDVIILDLDATDTPKIVNLVKQLNENGIPAKHKYGKVNAEFIGSGDYDGIIEAERSKIGAETGFDIDAFVQEAAGKYDAIKAARTEPVIPQPLKDVESTTKALEPIVNERKSSIGVKLRNLVGLIAHNGSEAIRKFDPSKIVGQTRGRYGKGFYFSSLFKNFDYGDKSTYLDSSKLNLLNGDMSVSEAINALSLPAKTSARIFNLNNLLSKSKNNAEYNEISKEIDRLEKIESSFDDNSKYIQKALEKSIEENPNQSFGSLLENLESRVIESNKLQSGRAVKGLNESLNDLLLKSGFDGISFTEGNEILIIPQEKLNNLIVSSQEKAISEAYHKAKQDGSNPELVKAVEDLLGGEAVPEAKAEVPETQKSIADKIRGLKIDLSKLGGGGAQSNIAGLPVALYNTVVEAVALAVEAGVSINKAIKDAIAKYNLNKQEGFDEDAFASSLLKESKSIEAEDSPVYFDNLKKFASESSFANKIEFKKAIQNLLQSYLPKLKEKYGKAFKPSDYNDNTKKYLSDVLTKEALNAISEHPEAIGWYDDKTQSALDVISAIHPEIATDSEARGAFILPLAVMSNGNKVDFNFDLAEKQYDYFKKNGRFNPDGNFGLQQSGIKKSLMLINSLLDSGLTMSDINKFLTSKYRAGDLKVKIDGKIKNLASGELADELVYGATILGPKIGNGFYMNLWGQFDQLTMDRWFMRTWGRHTGTLLEIDKQAIADGKKRLSDAINTVKSDPDALAKLKSVVGKLSGMSSVDLAKSIEKASMDKDKRAILASNPKTDELRKAGNSLSKTISGEKEAPANGKERKFIRDVFNDVVSRLKSEHGIEISMADLQAALWYPEKILYESFKGGKTFEEAAEGYTSESAPDYLNAAKKLATKLGINETEINQALSRGRGRAERGIGAADTGVGPAISESDKEILGRVTEAIGGPRGLEGLEKAAKTVRSLKIKQEGLQANIAGIPIAIYNAALETIATALEAGASLKDAIDQAIKKHQLNKQKGFNVKEFIKPLEDASGQTYPKVGGNYAIQIETAGEVPVQPKARVSEEVEGRVPGAKLEEAPKEAKAEGKEKVTPGEMVGIKHEATEEMRLAYSLPEYERPEGKTMDELEAEADQKIKAGYNVETLIKKLEDGNPPSGVENVILAKYLGVLNADFDKTKNKETLAKIERVVSALDIIGTIQSEAFRTRKIMKPKEDTLAQYFMDEKADAGVEELTEQQEATITREYEEIKAAKEALQKKVEELQEQNAKLLAEGNIAEEKKKVKKTRKTDADFKQERKNIVTNIKDKLKKARTQSNVTVVPYANELFTISPEIAKLVKSYVEQGIVKLEDIVNNIHELLKDDIKDITKKDVQDLIAGEYQKKKPTKNELAAKVRDLKTEAKLLVDYEKLEAGVPKTEKQKIEKNRGLSDLRKRIKEHDLTKLSEAKSRMKAQIEKVEQQIAKGDFEKAPEKKVIKLDEEGRKLQAKLTKLKKERDVRRLTLQYQKQNKVQRTFNKVLEVFNIPRSLMASTDFSAPLNQAVIATINYPKEAKDAAVQMVKAAASQEAFDNWFYDLKETPRYELMNKLKLGITDPFNPELTAREEAFMSGYAEQIPGVGRLVKGSERAYVQYLNKLRVDLFNKFIDKFEADGKTYENNKKLYESAAKYINNITGRGELGPLKKFSPLFSALFFSPRLMAARINMLNPYYFATLPTELKKQYGKDMGTALGILSTMLTLFALYGKTQDDDDEDKITVETDPRSSDFGRVRQGDTRWDFSGGFQPYLRAVTQFTTAERKKTSTGEIMELEGKMPGSGRQDIVLGFFRNKLAPVPSMIIDFTTGKNAVGEKVELKDELLKNVIPLSFQSIYEGYEKKGPQAIATVGLPAIFGVGVSTYEQRKKEVPETIMFQDRKIELSGEQKEEFQRIFDERNTKNLERLKALPDYKNSDKIMRGEMEQLVENKSLNESKELLGKKYRRDFLIQPKETEPKEVQRVKSRFKID